jgi:chromosome partitioning protein
VYAETLGQGLGATESARGSPAVRAEVAALVAEVMARLPA